MKYNSKIDAYNWIIMGLTLVVMALPNLIFDFSWLYFAFMLVFDIVVLGQTFTTTYKLGEEELEVRSGFFKFGIYYDRILKISKVKNLMDGAYSTALKSVRIEFGSKDAKKPYMVDISPSKEEEFLTELKSRCHEVGEIEDKRK